MFAAKYGLSGPSKRIQSTDGVPQRIGSHLETIVSRALQPQDGRIPCPVGRNLEIFLTSHLDFLFIFEQCGDNCKLSLFLKSKVGVTECPRSLNPSKAIAMAIWPIIMHFSTQRERSMHDVACEIAWAVRMHRKKIARTSLICKDFHFFRLTAKRTQSSTNLEVAHCKNGMGELSTLDKTFLARH